jgi:hypothetical protein
MGGSTINDCCRLNPKLAKLLGQHMTIVVVGEHHGATAGLNAIQAAQAEHAATKENAR